MRKKICFFIFLFRISSKFERYIFRLLAKTLQKFSKLSSACPEEPFVAWIFFKFWIVSDFLQKPLAWFSKFYLRVQSKNCGKNSFFCFSFQNFFSNFERYIFRFLAKTLQKFSKLSSACPEEPFVPLNFFKKSSQSFWIFCRNLRHGSQNSIYVSRVKIAEETVFLFFFSDFFSDFERKIFQTFGQRTSKICQNYLLRVQRNNLCSKYFLKVLKRYWLSAETFGMVLKFLYTCPEQKLRRNSFLIFLFRIFSEFERKIFQTFGQKTSKSCQNYLLRVQRNNLWLEIFFKSFEA